ncbi:carbohydrate esterase family 5 protein [Cercospora zeae-maydis SCOH1-5]|uniref:Carbohydrate esterase family 5 protein n=1 Tax=Cercospora zeae-maydis SCOH1-5 TaxID=717836 RepID=A0A6A6FW26_9PEZI|nr:carbohydrate esterase family 5 protein [Cercospora zeae-maydis SCOH1-5]
MVALNFGTWLVLACSATAAVIERQAGCSSYTIINTRGTGESQGESSGFRTMNANVRGAVPGGKVYNTVYPASFSQQSAGGTRDIVNKIQSTLRMNMNECFILEGYSQGAAATVDALPQLTGNAFNAVKGVFLIGNPDHKRGLACNVDNNGGTTTRNVDGLSARSSQGIPRNWISKTLDVCILGDGVCDTTNGRGINSAHLRYPRDAATQALGTQFITARLRGGS